MRALCDKKLKFNYFDQFWGDFKIFFIRVSLLFLNCCHVNFYKEGMDHVKIILKLSFYN